MEFLLTLQDERQTIEQATVWTFRRLMLEQFLQNCQ